MSRKPMAANMRAAAVAMLEAYRESAGIKLNVYPGRPRSITPPHAFVDSIPERVGYFGQLRQRVPTAQVVVIHSVFDAADAAAQRDAFVDGFLNWATDEGAHAAGGNSTLGIVEVSDDPNWIADWLPPDRQFQYYATTFSIEGQEWG